MHLQSIRATVALAGLLAILGTASPRVAFGGEVKFDMTATLDGRPIALVNVVKYFCDDFAFPVITCSTTAAVIETRVSAAQVAAVDYVTIYDAAGFGGSYMHVSQDYAALSFIGWNDRISSYRARNFETGRFWTDWYDTGTSWPFCCNQQAGSLGGYDNTFSSIQRT